jgi:hypothetical protein
MKCRSFFSFLLLLSVLASGCARAPALRKIVDPTDDKFTVQVTAWPKGKKEGPSVVIFPPTGGSNFLDRAYARQVADLGGHPLILESWTGWDEVALDPELHDRHISRAIRAYDLVAKEFGLAAPRILGTSVGGMYAAIIVGLGRPVEKLVVIAAGAPFSSVLSHSDQSQLIKLKADRKATWGFTTDEEYERMLAGALSQDFLKPKVSPLFIPGASGGISRGYGTRLHPDDTLVVVLKGDTTVSTESQLALWEAVGQGEKIERSASHVWGIARTYWSDSQKITRFLVKRP